MVGIKGHEAYILCDSLPYRSKRIDIGVVSEISEPYESKLSETPIMGLPSERKILMDLSVSNTKTLTYKRVSPRNPQDDYSVDSTNWSNGFWMYNVQKYLINRFQMDTDGCRLVFRVLNEDGLLSELYPPIQGQNCYISGFGLGYSAGNPFELSGDISVKIGSCRGSKSGIYTVTYHSNFASITSGISAEATYCQVSYGSNPMVDEYPISWEQLIQKTFDDEGKTPPAKSGWWWGLSTVEEFDTAYNNKRAHRWEDDDWKDLPSEVTSVQDTSSEIHLYARYSGFHKKWE